MRSWVEIAVVAAVLAVILGVFSWAVAADTIGVLLLYSVLPVALFAALRFGVRGAVTVVVACIVCISMVVERGGGPFMVVPFASRHALHYP